VIRGISLSIFNTIDGSTTDKTCARLPVRIGRNSLNDVRLALPFVSQFHAVIEIHESRLLLHDLGSTNGTQLPNQMHVPPNGYFALEECNYEFSIHPFVIHVTPLETEQPSSRRARSEEEITHIMMPGDSSPAPEQFASLYQSYRGAFAQLHQAIAQSVEKTPSHEREAYLVNLARAYPALATEPEFRGLSKLSKQTQEVGTGADEIRLAHAALAQLRRLSARYLPPHQRLFSDEDVESFIEEVISTLDVLFRCFLPLRDGHKQFETQMRLERGSRPGPGRRASLWRRPRTSRSSRTSCSTGRARIRRRPRPKASSRTS
jgi:type VI secretion system protein ImpI